MAKQEGEWKTIKGRHVLIGGDGTVLSGPKELKGKKIGSGKSTSSKSKSESSKTTKLSKGKEAQLSNFYRSNSQKLNKSRAVLPSHMKGIADKEVLSYLEQNHPKPNSEWKISKEPWTDLMGNTGTQRYVSRRHISKRPRPPKK